MSKPVFGEWVSVKDALPEHLDKCIVSFDGSDNVMMAAFQIRLGIGPEFMIYFADGRHPSHSNVTHWMPLPEPPKQ